MDNAQIHHNGRIKEIVEAHGCHLVYLPPYSPDLNPIEKAFSVLKAAIRRYGELNGGETDGDEIENFARLILTPNTMRGLFRGSGYIN
jgi:transposase